MNRRLFISAAIAAPFALHPHAVLGAELPPGVKLPPTWDDLVLAKSERLEAVYLLPGADFRPYTKLMMDPTEVAFRKDWLRDYNESAPFLQKVDDEEAKSIMAAVRKGFEAIFAKSFTAAGYPVVTTPDKDVLRLRSAVANLSITAPDTGASMSNAYAKYAGQATLILEARDSMTAAVLGRAEDMELAGANWQGMRDSVTNKRDFTALVQKWADASVKGLEALKANSPFDPAAKG
jgi:hypothetical protein